LSKTSPSELVRALGWFDATSLVVGSMIGSGIFIVSAESARVTGSSGCMLAAWLVAGAMTLVASICCAELAAMLPRAGGQYSFFREAYGPAAGFLFGWTLMLVVQTGTIAAVAVAFARFFGQLVPAISSQATLLALGPLQVSPAQALAVAVVLGLTATNAVGVRVASGVQNVFTAAKLLGLLGLVALGLFCGTRSVDLTWAVPSSTSGMAPLTALAVAMVGPLFSQSAWNNVTFAGEEVRSPGTTLPRALLAGCLLVTGLYVAANLAYLSVLSLAQIQSAPEDRVATAMMTALLGDHAARLMAVVIMVSTFGCVNGLILSGARVSFAMARDGLFFRSLAQVSVARVPRNALWAQAAWAVVLVLSGGYSALLRYVVTVDLAFFALLVVAVLVLRRRRPDLERPFMAPAAPLLVGAYAVAAVALIAVLLVERPAASAWGYGLALTGVPIYAVWSRRRVPP
jgi:APA family basic amino acid/polyamine antiporter